MKRLLLTICCIGSLWISSFAQVNTVQFGKNRVQYKNFHWRYYQAPNFNVYFADGGLNIAKFVVQAAEEELPGIERFVDYGMQRRANIIVYNSYNEYRQSNIGMDFDWQSSGGMTKLVNSKLVVYYTSDHNDWTYWEFKAAGSIPAGPATIGAAFFYSPNTTGPGNINSYYYELNGSVPIPKTKFSVSGAGTAGPTTGG